jgi:hypothetical protein
MRLAFALGCFALATLLLAGRAAAGDPPLQIVTATYLGTAEDDDLQGACAASDGTIYVVGNTGAKAEDLPGGVRAAAFGDEVADARCGHGFVAHLSADGKKLLHYAEFAKGIVLLTTVQAGDGGVYLGGYASHGLDALLKDRPGLMRLWPLAAEMRQIEEDRAAGKKDPIAGRPGLGRYGAPCVLRLSNDVAQIESGTYLEGWQQVWDKNRVAKFGKEMNGPYHEFFWQPTHLALLKSGDLVVGHDGGYFRLPTAKEKVRAGGDDKKLDQLMFYDVCDWVSRLSPDLAERRWKTPIYTPPTDAATAKWLKNGWSLPHYSNPRTHRMRLDSKENVYLCGWSASFTSAEPWWSPYMWRLDPQDGRATWKAYEYDPMSGGGNRMGGTVADTAIATLAVEDDGHVLVSLFADGGNTVIGMSPKAEGSRFEGRVEGKQFGVKLVHWWGQIHRVDVATRQGLGGARVGPWGWAVDLASLPGRNVLAVGRYNAEFEWTADAWHRDSSIANPNAFVRCYSADFELLFSTSVPGLVPFELSRIGPARYILVGRAEHGVSPTKDALVDKSPGKTDGYLMILDWRGSKP